MQDCVLDPDRPRASKIRHGRIVIKSLYNNSKLKAAPSVFRSTTRATQFFVRRSLFVDSQVCVCGISIKPEARSSAP
jgi:hypothetical protein